MKSKDRLDVPEAVIIRAARRRAELMGNQASELAINDVAQRPVFREPIIGAYAEGWMDAIIYMETRAYERKQKRAQVRS